MGNIQTLHDTGALYEITPKMDGGTYQRFKDGICAGIGDEFAITYTNASLDVQFAAGSQCLIGGAFFKVKALESVRLAPNATIYLCANIDLTRPNGETGSFEQRTASNMTSDNLNNGNGSRDLLLYVITTSASGVTSVEDKRVVLGNENSINGYGISVISEAAYEALASKDSNTLYFIYEE